MYVFTERVFAYLFFWLANGRSTPGQRAFKSRGPCSKQLPRESQYQKREYVGQSVMATISAIILLRLMIIVILMIMLFVRTVAVTKTVLTVIVSSG